MTEFSQRVKHPAGEQKTHPHEQQEPVSVQSDRITDILNLQRTVGNRAATQMLQRRIVNQTLGETATKLHGVTYLKTLVGAYDATGRGTGPTTGEPSNIKNVGPIDGRYVGGHMFNQDLGGYGTWDNMIVQSEDSNKKMNKHDNILKRLAQRALQLDLYNRNPVYEYGAIEEITVDPAAPDTSLTYTGAPTGLERFTGEQYVPAGLTVTITPVKQKVGQPGTRVGWDKTAADGHNESIDASYYIPNVPPYPPLVATGARRGKIGGKKKATTGVKAVKMAGKAHLHTARLKLKNKKATKLTKADFLTIPLIGEKGADALVAYFTANKVRLSTLVGATGLKRYNLNKTIITALLAEGIQ